MADSDLFDGDPLGVTFASPRLHTPGAKPDPADSVDVTVATKGVKHHQLGTGTADERALVELYVYLAGALKRILAGSNGGRFDAAYDTMVDLLIDLRVQPDRFKFVSNIPGYIITSALHSSYRYAERAAHHRAILNNVVAQSALAHDATEEPDSAAYRKDLRREISNALEQLPPSWREVAVQRLIRDTCTKDAARHLGLETRTVYNYLREARKSLRVRLIEASCV
jgi:RNA polymerase sigma factor (sigma-70 family)